MSAAWVPVRNVVFDGTLRSNNPAATEVAGRFDALLRVTALQLSIRLGTDAVVAYTRKEVSDPSSRISGHVTNMVNNGRLEGSLRIPNTASLLRVVVDLRARQVVCSVEVDAPKEGRPTTKVHWLIRQPKEASDKTRLECNVVNQRGTAPPSRLGTSESNQTR